MNRSSQLAKQVRLLPHMYFVILQSVMQYRATLVLGTVRRTMMTQITVKQFLVQERQHL